MMKTILSLMIATCGCWTGSAAAQSTTPPTAQTASSNEADAEPQPAPASTAPVIAGATPATARTATPPTVAAAEPATDEPAAAEPAPAPPPVASATSSAPALLVEKSGYLTAGGLYLPIDDGYLAVNAGAGMRVRSGIQEGRLGARLSYGSSPYSQVFAVLVGGTMLRWWGSFGMGLGADLGLVIASEKMGGGWDGTTFGGTLTGTFRHRFVRTELSFDLGLIYAAGQDDPTAPFAMISVMAPL